MIFQYIDYICVIVFSFTGAIIAYRSNLDFIAILFFSTLTGIGGGTLRDIILGIPVFWISSNKYLIICTCISIIVLFFGKLLDNILNKPLKWADAIGLSFYSVIGTAKTLSLNKPILVSILMGVATATLGGVLRDILAGKNSAIITPTIYISAAFLGSSS